MATNVIMPQLGESVVEGTVTKWLKHDGDPVQEFDPIMEVNTDKVDTEIPAPASGTLLKVYVPEGTTVKAGTLLDVELLDHLIVGQGRHVSLRTVKPDLFPPMLSQVFATFAAD